MVGELDRRQVGQAGDFLGLQDDRQARAALDDLAGRHLRVGELGEGRADGASASPLNSHTSAATIPLSAMAMRCGVTNGRPFAPFTRAASSLHSLRYGVAQTTNGRAFTRAGVVFETSARKLLVGDSRQRHARAREGRAAGRVHRAIEHDDVPLVGECLGIENAGEVGGAHVARAEVDNAGPGSLGAQAKPASRGSMAAAPRAARMKTRFWNINSLRGMGSQERMTQLIIGNGPQERKAESVIRYGGPEPGFPDRSYRSLIGVARRPWVC